MRIFPHTRAALAGVCVLALVLGPAFAFPAPEQGAPGEAAALQQARAAAERGLAFLQKDAGKWKAERQCSTCHHGTMTVWALAEAKKQGYSTPPEALAETAKWTKDRLLERIDLPRDTRPGWKMVSTPAIYLAVMAQAVPDQDAVSADELRRIAGHLARHQEEDGSWAWSSAPPRNRPPPVFESDEVATLLACLAVQPRPPAAKDDGAARAMRDKAAAWLAKTEPGDQTQAALLRLVAKARSGKSGRQLRSEIQAFFARQNPDGGWGQLRSLASDAYATGQALYLLNLAGVKSERPEIQRGAAFLAATQKADGSWPMTQRSQPGATPGTNAVPIVYFGSAWATLGLMRSAPR